MAQFSGYAGASSPEGGGAVLIDDRPQIEVGWRPCWEFFRDGVKELARRHWDEVGVRKADLPLEVDWDGMARAERRGEFRAIGAYVQDRLVGYNAFALTKSFHYTMMHAINDAIFVDPEHANCGIGKLLIDGFELDMKQFRFGLPFRVLYHVKLGLPPERDLGRLLEKCGYVGFQTQYDKIVRP